MSQYPDDPDALKAWFRTHFDPLTGHAEPFDRARFWASTVPGVQGRRMRKPFGLRELGAAVVTAVLLVGGGFAAGRLIGHGAPVSATAATPPHAAFKAAVPATASALGAVLPPGASRIELSESVGSARRSVVITGSHDIAVLTGELARAPALGPGVYNCPAGPSPAVTDTFRFFYPSGQIVTVNWVQAGCSWLTVNQGAHARPVTAGMAGPDTFSAPSGLQTQVNLAFQR
jgi:hypothetical protein